MALVENLLPRHDHARHVPVVLRNALRAEIFKLLLREIGGGHHRLDAGQRDRLRGVDRADARMGVRRAQDAAHQHAGHREVGSIERASRHLRHAVRTNRPRPDPFELCRGCFRGDILHGGLRGGGIYVWEFENRAAGGQMQAAVLYELDELAGRLGGAVGVLDMNAARGVTLDFETIVNAFDVMGRYLRDQCSTVGEIAVYGGTAMLLQFPWRRMTEDVDVTILTVEREGAVKDAAVFA